jgi:hypothetical protein
MAGAKTIHHAANNLTPAAAKALISAFKETCASDIYDGVLECYLQIIDQTLRDRSKQLSLLKQEVRKLALFEKELWKKGRS